MSTCPLGLRSTVFPSPPDLGHIAVCLPDLSLEVRMAELLFCTVSLPRMCQDSSPCQGAPSFPCLCFAEVMKASQQAIERGVKDCLFVDYKRRSGHFDVTTVASIKEITEKVPVASDQGLGFEHLGLDAWPFWISALRVSWAFSELACVPLVQVALLEGCPHCFCVLPRSPTGC